MAVRVRPGLRFACRLAALLLHRAPAARAGGLPAVALRGSCVEDQPPAPLPAASFSVE